MPVAVGLEGRFGTSAGGNHYQIERESTENYLANSSSSFDWLNPTTISSLTMITGTPICPDF